ncbi:MAG: FixH family protein [Planctomycetota bacterium]|nr:FixH family protein [Planctomycetota bacterium]
MIASKMISANKETDIVSERSSRRFWVCMVLAFFSMDIALATIAITMATRDPSFRPMPDYGQNNVSWEHRHQERLASNKLGWTVDLSPIEPDRKAIQIFASDRSGKPVVGATGKLSAYHFARVTGMTRADIVEVAPGEYEAAVDCSRDGMWKIELRLQSGDEQFLLENDVEFSKEVATPIVKA